MNHLNCRLAIAVLLGVDRSGRYDLQGLQNGMDPLRYGQQLVGWTEQAVNCGGDPVRIGMVDTPVEVMAPLLQRPSIRTQSFLSDGRRAP